MVFPTVLLIDLIIIVIINNSTFRVLLFIFGAYSWRTDDEQYVGTYIVFSLIDMFLALITIIQMLGLVNNASDKLINVLFLNLIIQDVIVVKCTVGVLWWLC